MKIPIHVLCQAINQLPFYDSYNKEEWVFLRYSSNAEMCVTLKFSKDHKNYSWDLIEAYNGNKDILNNGKDTMGPTIFGEDVKP